MVKKMRLRVVSWLLILSTLLLAAGAAATSTAEITVTSQSCEPTHLFRGDTGKLTVTIQNTGDSTLNIYSAQLDSPRDGFRILNDKTYDTVGVIGPDDTRTFTFTFEADVPEGIYYPKFYLDLDTEGSFRQYIPVEVKNTELIATVDDVPDAFSAGKKSRVVIAVGNPRQGTVNGVTITPVGDGVTFSPQQAFIGELTTDKTKNVTFEVTAEKETAARFLVTYRNGMNDHETTVTLPIRFGEDKLGAEVILNNVGIENGAQYNTISGDINNAGLTSAYSVTVTVGSPATAIDPNKIYVIGELEPDDFASFEVTYTATGSTVPVVVTYKDADGNTFTETFDASLSAGGASSASGVSGSGGSSGSGTSGAPSGGMSLFGMRGGSTGSASIPFTQIGIGLVVAVVIVIVAWKKGYLRKLIERIQRRNKREDDDDITDR